MKEVLLHIENKKQEFANLEFFKFLQDKSIPPRQRLAFAPCFAPFAMGFGELNRYVWRDEPTNDPIQAIINQQTYEDDDHWIWFLEDLQKLDLDKSFNFTDTLKFLWSEEIQILRQTFYEIYRYTYKAIPIHKLLVIEVVEATADIFFSATTKVVKELDFNDYLEYKYFGIHHLLIDSNHNMDASETIEYVSNIELENNVAKKAFELVDETFKLFSQSLNVLLDYAKINDMENPFSDILNKKLILK